MTEFHPLRTMEQHYGTNNDDNANTWFEWNTIATQLAKDVPSATVPSLDHVSMDDYNHVYEPSDDTYLLLDAIQYDILSLSQFKSLHNNTDEATDPTTTNTNTTTSQTRSIRTALEIGCGSGVPIVYLGQLLNRLSSQQRDHEEEQQEDDGTVPRNPSSSSSSLSCKVELYATDINPYALEIAKQTAIENGLKVLGVVDGETIDNSDEQEQQVNDSNPTSATPSSSPTSLDEHVVPTLELIQCDLGSEFLSPMSSATTHNNNTHMTFDIILFNPPYVPTPDDEIQGNDIEVSWAGGTNGRRVIDRFLVEPYVLPSSSSSSSSINEVKVAREGEGGDDVKDEEQVSTKQEEEKYTSQLSKLLSKPNGICYMITVDDNEPEQLSNQLREEQGLVMKPLLRRRARNEYLTVQKITWI